MKAIMLFCEFLLGFVVLFFTLVTIFISLFVALTELPRYIRYKNK